MNLACVSGNFGFDPEFKVSNNGTPIFTGSLCVQNRSRKKTNFIDLVAFNKTAELMRDHCKKGSFLLVEDGELDMDEWVNKEGKKQRKIKIIVNRMNLGPKSKPEGEGGQDADGF
tara:strand:+ start:2469 stop:2813 length:345 start_codon:yes stop_codon:yes gene_type:complete